MRRSILLAKSTLGLGLRRRAAFPLVFTALMTGALAALAPGAARAQLEAEAPAPPAAAAASAPQPVAPAQPMLTAQPAMLAAPKGSQSVESNHAIAFRARWLTVPGWTLSPYLAAHTELNDGWSVGMEYLYRHTGFDVVVSVDYSSLGARDGNFLGGSNNPATETHFIHFDGLASLSADVSLIGHWNLASWLEFRFGAGLGVGYVFGDIYQITDNSGCTADNANDSTKCYPKPRIGPIASPTTPDTVAKLQGARCSPDFTDGGRDTPDSPCYRKTDTYPFNVRIIPVLNVLLGLRFKLYQHVYLHLEGGFRLAGFYAGGGPEFRF